MLLLDQLAAGAVPEQSGAATGTFDVPTSRTATAQRLQASTAIGTGIPYGAALWPQPFDPADHLAYGFSFKDLLDNGETITAIERIAVSATGAGMGLTIDQSAGFQPIIDQNGGQRIQLWFSVDPALQASSAFDASGTSIAVTFRILSSKSNRIERSAVLMVRQL